MTVNVAIPVAFVVCVLPGAMVEWPAPCARVIVLPGAGLPLLSFRVTVIVAAVAPSAGTDDGLAVTVDVLPLPVLLTTSVAGALWLRDPLVPVKVNV